MRIDREIPKPGPGQPRKSLSRANAARSMALLDPLAVETIERCIRGELKDRLRYDAACLVYAYNHGKPKQAVEATGELTITVKWEEA